MDMKGSRGNREAAEAGARDERTLEGVGCRRLLDHQPGRSRQNKVTCSPLT
jgi:hypothetical protein